MFGRALSTLPTPLLAYVTYMSVLTPSAILGPEGALASMLPGYETRTQQLEMAETVAQAIADKEHAVIEAPTGVGKSFAYLVPAAQHALNKRQKVVISTGTIALQEQLVEKDIPLLEQVFPGLKAVLVKGRQNYISIRRLSHAASGQAALFQDRDEVTELNHIVDWSDNTSDGDRADLGFEPAPNVWRRVQSDRGNCMGRRCPHYESCFFYQARREIEDADLIIVNHHLYFADLAMRDDHSAILPKHEVVIFDEAHSLEDIATDHLGCSVSEAQIRYFLDGLWNPSGKQPGLFSQPGKERGQGYVDTCREANQAFWRDVAAYGARQRESQVRIHEDADFDATLPDYLEALTEQLLILKGRASDENEAMELRAQADKAIEITGTLRSLVQRQLKGHVYYASLPEGRGTMHLSAHPLTVAEPMRNLLFDCTDSVILTSATLAADDSERFLFFRRRIGVEGGLAKRLGSPYDYKQQARLLLNESTMDPNSERYEQALAQWLGDFLEDARGGTFILFTSYRQLEAVHELMRARLDRANRFVLRQGDRLGRSKMIELFKQTGDAVLFGTASFWEGVDVQGEALSNVIITKLPFEMPAHPLVEARHAEIRKNGGNPFMERSVPEAILRLKQGVGRLIRTRKDTGCIVIADHRVLTKQYGRYFIRALPEMQTEHFRLAQT